MRYGIYTQLKFYFYIMQPSVCYVWNRVGDYQIGAYDPGETLTLKANSLPHLYSTQPLLPEIF